MKCAQKPLCPRSQDYKENKNSTQINYHAQRARAYKVTSFLSTDCELSTETCSKNVYSPGLRSPVMLLGRDPLRGRGIAHCKGDLLGGKHVVCIFPGE